MTEFVSITLLQNDARHNEENKGQSKQTPAKSTNRFLNIKKKISFHYKFVNSSLYN